jgi:catechol 2,3-dioxygenase-like lactoylglutathione lyase family enzyme
MDVRGLDHVQLAIPPGGEAEARAFYGKLLGLTEVRKPAALEKRGGLWLVGPGIHLHLGVESPFHAARKAHVALLVHDIAAAQVALEAAGVTLMRDDADIGVDRFYALDPFGNRLEFVAEGDAGFTTALGS